MSRYCVVRTQFKDKDALIQALAESSGWTVEQIEVHLEPQHLSGYRGDQRTEKAHIIIRRKHIGSASNDIGFIKNENGTYEAIVSAYDTSRYGEKWIAKVKQNYAFHTIRTEQEARGRSVTRTTDRETGRQRVEIVGYR